MFAGLAQAGGSAAGPLLAGVLAEWAPDPLRLPFIVGLALTVVAAVATMMLSEPPGRAREPWRIQRPRVPREILGAFARVSVTAATVWATVALYLSIVPSYTELLLSTKDLAVVGAIAALGLAASFVAQAVLERAEGSQRRDQAFG